MPSRSSRSNSSASKRGSGRKSRSRKSRASKSTSSKSSTANKGNQRRRTREERTEEFSVLGIGEGISEKISKEQTRVRRGDRRRIKEVERRGKSALLQVDLPSMAARSMKLRKWRGRLGWALTILALGLLALGVANLWVQRVLFAQPQAVAWHLRVQSDGWREAGWVAKQLGFEQGKPNLLSLDLEVMGRELEADPGVVEAVLTRSLVGKAEAESVLKVELRERHPVAWLAVPSRGLRPMSAANGLLLDAQGYGWQPRELRSTWSELPVIKAARLQQIPLDKQSEVNALLGAVRLVEQLAAPEFVQRDLQATRVRVIWEGDVGMDLEPFRLEVETRAQQQLLFSLDEQLSGSLARQCERLLSVYDRLAERQAGFQRLNLCLPNELPGELYAAANSTGLIEEGFSGQGSEFDPEEILEAEPIDEPELRSEESLAGAVEIAQEGEQLAEQGTATVAADHVAPNESGSVFEANFEDDLESVLQSQREY